MNGFILSLMLLLATAAFSQTKTPSDKHFWHSMETSASPERIWEVWTDVSRWHTWDTGLQAAALEGPFGLGAKGTLTSLEGRTSRFKIVALEPGISYTFKSTLPMGGLYVKRTLARQGAATVFTHEVWFQGLTGGLFARMLGAEFRAMLPGVMAKVRLKAEGKASGLSDKSR